MLCETSCMWHTHISHMHTHALCFWFYTCQGVGANDIRPHRHHWHCMSSSVKCWVPISFAFQVSWLVSAHKSLTMVIISFTKAGKKTPSQLNTWKVSDKKKVTGGTSNQTCFKKLERDAKNSQQIEPIFFLHFPAYKSLSCCGGKHLDFWTQCINVLQIDVGQRWRSICRNRCFGGFL